MSSTWNRMKRFLGTAVPTSIAVLAMGSGVAHAQTTLWELDGSDTLTEVILNAITQSHASIHYNNKGSGQAEKNMASLTDARFLQGIGPMSRNFTTAVLQAHSVDPDNWAPTDANVLALDAGLVCVGTKASTGYCPNISAPLVTTDDPSLAAPNSDLAVVMAGYPKDCFNLPAGSVCTATSKGTTEECAHPKRLDALTRINNCQGGNRIDHLYRRDDSSGTQDTFREHLQTKYWCNGRSKGPSNLDNEDLDPIRRPCIGADLADDGVTVTNKRQSRCTFYPLNITCTAQSPVAVHHDATYGDIKCTQGLIVALSETDVGSKDITLSIANRAAADANGFTMGLIGHACVEAAGKNGDASGTKINTITYEDDNIRAGQYMLSRRLFLQRNPNYLNYPGAFAARNTEEMKLFNWATNRCNIKQIVIDAGFLPPLDVCGAACDNPQNISCLAPTSGVSTPDQNVGAEGEAALGSSNKNPCVADGLVKTSGTCPVIPPQPATYKCNIGPKCSPASHTCNLDSTLLSGTCAP